MRGGGISRRALAGGLVLSPVGYAAAQTPLIAPSSLFISHPDVTMALSHLQARRWSDLGTLVGGLRPDSACVLLDDLADIAAVDADISGLSEAPLGHMIAGAMYVNWAWSYRGTGFGSTVVGDRAQAFEDRLVLARENLERAIDADLNDGVAYNFLIRTMKGQSDIPALDSLWRSFESIEVQRKPIRAFAGLADVLSAKWFGSEELMLGFARTQQRALEPASHALICQVANESLVSHLRREGAQAGVDFAAQQSVLGEVGAASEAYQAIPASEDFYHANFANNQFSFFFGFIGLSDYARPYLQSMGRALSGPWTLFDEQAFDMLEVARRAAGLGST
jgi:hypothetical protein